MATCPRRERLRGARDHVAKALRGFHQACSPRTNSHRPHASPHQPTTTQLGSHIALHAIRKDRSARDPERQPPGSQPDRDATGDGRRSGCLRRSKKQPRAGGAYRSRRAKGSCHATDYSDAARGVTRSSRSGALACGATNVVINLSSPARRSSISCSATRSISLRDAGLRREGGRANPPRCEARPRPSTA